jgi:hypothetical protein
VESGSVFATAYRASPAILHDKTTTPQHPCTFGKSACGELLFEILCVHIISFWGTLKNFLKIWEKKKKKKRGAPLHLFHFLFGFTCYQQRLIVFSTIIQLCIIV